MRCRNCLLPHEAPGADIDSRGICAFCRQHNQEARAQDEHRRAAYEADLEMALRNCRRQGEYDCLVNLSGGKDSCYLLYKLKREYGLNVLAFTTDMNVPDVAWDNIRRTVAALDVQHVVYRPDREVYR